MRHIAIQQFEIGMFQHYLYWNTLYINAKLILSIGTIQIYTHINCTMFCGIVNLIESGIKGIKLNLKLKPKHFPK